MKIKWETLKKKAIKAAIGDTQWYLGPQEVEMACYAMLKSIGDGSFNWNRNLEELRKEVVRIIDRWDVRCTKKLIDLFPGIVPKNCIGKVPRCYMADNEDCDWVVDFE